MFGLGEQLNSFAFCSSGNKVENANNNAYGKALKQGDIIGCWIYKMKSNVTLKFSINGEEQGVAWVRGSQLS